MDNHNQQSFLDKFYSTCFAPATFDDQFDDNNETRKLLEDYKCPICLDTFINTVKVDCCSGHKFCNFCIQSWINFERHLVTECPVCRGPIYGKTLDLKTDADIRAIFERLSEEKQTARLLAIKERLQIEYPSVQIHEFPMEFYQAPSPASQLSITDVGQYYPNQHDLQSSIPLVGTAEEAQLASDIPGTPSSNFLLDQSYNREIIQQQSPPLFPPHAPMQQQSSPWSSSPQPQAASYATEITATQQQQGENIQLQSGGEVYIQQYRHQQNQENNRWNSNLYLTPTEGSAPRFQVWPTTENNSATQQLPSRINFQLHQQSSPPRSFFSRDNLHHNQPLPAGETMEMTSYRRHHPAIRNLNREFEQPSVPAQRNLATHANPGAPGEYTALQSSASCPHYPQTGPQPSQLALPFTQSYPVGVPPYQSAYHNPNQRCPSNFCYMPSCSKPPSVVCNQFAPQNFQQHQHQQQRGYQNPQAGVVPVPSQSTAVRYFYPYNGQSCSHVPVPNVTNQVPPQNSGFWVRCSANVPPTSGQCLTPRMPGQNQIQMPSPPHSPPQNESFPQQQGRSIDPAGHMLERNGANTRSRRRQTQRRGPAVLQGSPPSAYPQPQQQQQQGNTDPVQVPNCTVRSSGSQFSGGFPLFSRGYVRFQITYSPHNSQDRRAVTPPGRVTHPLVSLVPLKPDGTSTRVTLTFEVHRV